MSELPAGWVVSDLGTVASLEMGQSPSGEATNVVARGVPLVGGAADFKGGEIQPSRYTDQPTKVSLPGDLILCIRATIGKAAVGSTSYCLGRGVAGLRPTAIEQALLRYLLAKDAEDLDAAGTGTTFRQVDKTTLSKWPVPLPPFAEQRRIVTKLDALTARTARARADLDRVPALAVRYKQAVLAKAFSGELTAEWRRDHGDVAFAASEVALLKQQRSTYQNGRRGSRLREVPSLVLPGQCADLPPTWASGCVADVADLRVGYAFKSAWFKDAGVPLVRGANVGVGTLDCDDLKHLSPEQAQDFDAYRLGEGDILLAMDRPLISAGLKIARVAAAEAGALLVQRVASPVPTPLVDTDFLWWLFHSHHYLGQIARHATGSDLPHVSGNDILTTSAPLPPLTEQHEIARRIARSIAEIDRMVAEAASARRLLDRLDQAVLAKAFRGELVPQDPADEPAGVLLDRIRAERAAAPKPARGRRKATA